MSRLALTVDGKLELCYMVDESANTDKCGHLAHQNDGEELNGFLSRGRSLMKKCKNSKKPNKEKEEDATTVAESEVKNEQPKGDAPTPSAPVYSSYKDLLNEPEDVKMRYIEEGNFLDVLSEDPSEEIRIAIVGKLYNLDKFAHDKNANVRLAVAKNGYHLDKLVNDRSYLIRAEVAMHDYALDKLIDDRNAVVRAAVARRGYNLSKLIDDPDSTVRNVAQEAYQAAKNLLNVTKGN